MLQKRPTLHVGVLDQGVEEVGGLYEGQSAVTQRGDGGVHADPDPGDGHVHEVSLLFLALVVLESLQELEESFLGHLAAATLQVSEAGEPEVGVEVVGRGVEGSADGKGVRVRAQLELGCLGMLELGGRLGSLVMLKLGMYSWLL